MYLLKNIISLLFIINILIIINEIKSLNIIKQQNQLKLITGNNKNKIKDEKLIIDNLFTSRQANIFELPYQVSIQIHINNNYNTDKYLIYKKHICSGIIINELIILTAAQCIDCKYLENYYNYSSYYIAAGNYNLKSNNLTYKKVTDVIIHPNYSGIPYNDIALLRIENKLIFNDNSLTKVLLTNSKPIENTLCKISGWKKLPNKYAKYLHIVNVHIDEIYCKNLPNYNNGYLICAKRLKKEKDCFGDIGSPLICNDKLVGIVSSIANCEIGYPDIYMDINYFNKWIIDNAININGMNRSINLNSILFFLLFIYYIVLIY